MLRPALRLALPFAGEIDEVSEQTDDRSKRPPDKMGAEGLDSLSPTPLVEGTREIAAACVGSLAPRERCARWGAGRVSPHSTTVGVHVDDAHVQPTRHPYFSDSSVALRRLADMGPVHAAEDQTDDDMHDAEGAAGVASVPFPLMLPPCLDEDSSPCLSLCPRLRPRQLLRFPEHPWP